MKASVVLLLALCLLLSGCQAFVDSSYEWEISHPIEVSPGQNDNVSADDYDALCRALRDLVRIGAEQGTVFVENYAPEQLEEDIHRAANDVCATDPIAAYAVEQIRCQLGSSGGKSALAVQISYLHGWSEIRKIKKVDDIGQAREIVYAALRTCEPGVVLLVEDFQTVYFDQVVADYALQWPQYVMELPQVSESIYPEVGQSRVVELKFAYQTSRESLKNMQNQVQRVFSSAALYVDANGTESEKLSQLYSFLMNRFPYKVETSITASYHLLWHGIGDSKAFASVYAAMCRQVGLEAMVVSGTHNAESWYWNIVLDDGVYYHVDLLRSLEAEQLQKYTDEEMSGYVWDFAAYPACKKVEEENLE